MSINKQLTKIKKLRNAYMDGTRRKLMRKEIKSWRKLLKGDSGNISSGRKSVFNRAKKYAADIKEKLGFEVLLLVLSSMNREQLARYDKKEQLLEALGSWWNAIPHLPALHEDAKCLYNDDEETDNEEIDDEEVHDEEVHDEEVHDEEVHDEEVHDEEVHDEEVDTITPKIMELGKSTSEHASLICKKAYFSSTRNNAPSTKHSRNA
jgi:Ran GTPase-activating protein (RanGAP) involved in mRNA processing and transport